MCHDCARDVVQTGEGLSLPQSDERFEEPWDMDVKEPENDTGSGDWGDMHAACSELLVTNRYSHTVSSFSLSLSLNHFPAK